MTGSAEPVMDPILPAVKQDALIDSAFGETRLARRLWPHQERAGGL
jgi:hypothetical protein